MRFKLSTTGNWYTTKDKGLLESLGFAFELDDHDKKRPWYKVPDYGITVEIASLDALMAFVDQWGTVIVDVGAIRIYDNYEG